MSQRLSQWRMRLPWITASARRSVWACSRAHAQVSYLQPPRMHMAGAGMFDEGALGARQPHRGVREGRFRQRVARGAGLNIGPVELVADAIDREARVAMQAGPVGPEGDVPGGEAHARRIPETAGLGGLGPGSEGGTKKGKAGPTRPGSLLRGGMGGWDHERQHRADTARLALAEAGSRVWGWGWGPTRRSSRDYPTPGHSPRSSPAPRPCSPPAPARSAQTGASHSPSARRKDP